MGSWNWWKRKVNTTVKLINKVSPKLGADTLNQSELIILIQLTYSIRSTVTLPQQWSVYVTALTGSCCHDNRQRDGLQGKRFHMLINNVMWMDVLNVKHFLRIKRSLLYELEILGLVFCDPVQMTALFSCIVRTALVVRNMAPYGTY